MHSKTKKIIGIVLLFILIIVCSYCVIVESHDFYNPDKSKFKSSFIILLMSEVIIISIVLIFRILKSIRDHENGLGSFSRIYYDSFYNPV